MLAQSLITKNQQRAAVKNRRRNAGQAFWTERQLCGQFKMGFLWGDLGGVCCLRVQGALFGSPEFDT